MGTKLNNTRHFPARLSSLYSERALHSRRRTAARGDEHFFRQEKVLKIADKAIVKQLLVAKSPHCVTARWEYIIPIEYKCLL